MTDDPLATSMTVADHDLDDPAVRAAALAVVADLATIPPSLSHPRGRARRAVAVAAACLVTAGAAATYTVATGAGTATVDPAAVTGPTTETLPGDASDIDTVCDALRTWLAPEPATDVEKARRLAHIYSGLALYQYHAELADDTEQLAEGLALEAAVDAGDRRTVELFTSESCQG
ncbi:MAG TPA: hypothetical protein VH479_18715 [Acidimicrobiales bacterium]|jgi:hypothetical protein